MGTTDPGSNTISSSSDQYTFYASESRWYTSEITVSVSARLTVLHEYIDGTVTVSQGGSSAGSFEFNFGRSPVIETETKSGTFNVDPGEVTIQISYRYYDYLSDQDLGSYILDSSVTQGKADGRNVDQRAYPAILGMMYIISFGTLVAGIFTRTDKLDKWLIKKSTQNDNDVQFKTNNLE